MAHELNIGTINGLSIDQILSKMADKKIGIDLGADGKYVPQYDFIEGNISIGSIVTMDSREWIVVDINSAAQGSIFLITKDIIQTTQFGSNNTYSGSTIATLAKTFENNLSSEVKAKLITRTVYGVTQKVHIPTYNECNGGIEYFASASSRIGYYNGTATYWWTCSPGSSDGSVYYVGAGGGVYDGGYPGFSYGFRPFVALAM